jgi:hypothetical protein
MSTLLLIALMLTAQARQPESLDTFLVQVEAAQRELVQGRPEPFKALWSQSADVTLAGGLGGAFEKGWERVSARLSWVGTQYREGTRIHEQVSRAEGPDFAYLVQRETIRSKAADGTAQVQEVRSTMIFRREQGRWRIVHRHADTLATRQPLR